MKKIIMALAILGMVHFAADAHTKGCPVKKARTHKVASLGHKANTIKLAKTYQVCKEEGGYYTCCVYKKNALATLR